MAITDDSLTADRLSAMFYPLWEKTRSTPALPWAIISSIVLTTFITAGYFSSSSGLRISSMHYQ